MKAVGLFLLAFLLLGAQNVAGSSSSSDDNDAVASTDNSPVNEDHDSENGLVVKNPNYIGPGSDSDSDSDGDSDSADETDTESDPKSEVNKALSKRKKKRKVNLPRLALKLVRKHRLEITIALAVFAFRREIFVLFEALLFKCCSKPVRDPQTGEIVGRAVSISPTAVLKIVVLIDFIRRLQSKKATKGGPMLLLALLATWNPLLGSFLSKLLAPSNSAYIPPIEQHFTFERINERYTKDGMALQKAMEPPSHGGSPILPVQDRNSTLASVFFRPEKKDTAPPTYNETVILLDMTQMDSSVSRMEVLRDEISFLLSEHRTNAMTKRLPASPSNETAAPSAELEVIVILESPGGSASDYALASQQVLRLRNEPGINVTICVDKVAASGGYMIACTSSPGRLFAAPFAVLGSIGVIGQSVNIQKALQGWGIQPLVFRGGRDKAPVGLIGEVTKEGIAKVQDMVDDTHRAFKYHVATSRPIVSDRIEELATGDTWLGCDAIKVGLIDRIVTSDEYIGERMTEGARVLKLVQLVRPKYLFSRPTTSSQLSQARVPGARSLVAVLDEFRSLLDNASKTLSRFMVVDDHHVHSAAKTLATNDIRVQGSGSN